MVTLQLRTVLKGGRGYTYVIPGVQGVVLVQPSMFAAGVQAPQTLQIAFTGMAAPDPAVAAKAAAAAQRKANLPAILQERAAKAQARALKAAERYAKLAAAASPAPAAPASEAAAPAPAKGKGK